jgi:hypothetical protein
MGQVQVPVVWVPVLSLTLASAVESTIHCKQTEATVQHTQGMEATRYIVKTRIEAKK